jgi:hypothetical protein
MHTKITKITILLTAALLTLMLGVLLTSSVQTITASPAQNTAPVGVDDAYSTPYETPLNVPVEMGVLVNDTDAEGGSLTLILEGGLTASLTDGPYNGSLALNLNGSFIYTPTAGFSGADAFTYIVSDGELFDTATVNITVGSEGNTAPVGVDDAYSTPYETPLNVPVEMGVLTNDTDAEGDSLTLILEGRLTASLTDGPSNGSLALNLDGSFVYTPTAGFSGDDTFTYIVSDGELFDMALVNITVGSEGENTAPTISNISDQVIKIDTVLGPIPFNIGDVETDPANLALSSASSNPTLVSAMNIGFGGSGAARSLTITPTTEMLGMATITITVSDGELSAYDTFVLTVELYRIYLPLVLR